MKFRLWNRLFTCVLLLSATPALSQNIDSLKKAIANSTNDSLTVELCVQMSEVCEIAEIPYYSEKAILLCDKNLKNADRSNPRSRFFLRKKASAFNNIGYKHYFEGNVPGALDNYLQAIRLLEEVNDKKRLANTLGNIAFVYKSLDETGNAFDYSKRTLKISEEIRDSLMMANALNNLAPFYRDSADQLKAIALYERALLLYQGIHNMEGVSSALNNLGTLYSKREPARALDFYKRSLKIDEETGNKRSEAGCLENIAKVLYQKGEKREALEYAKRSFKIAEALGYPENLKKASQTLSSMSAGTGDFETAYRMRILYERMADSVNNESNRKASLQKSYQFAYEKKVAADSLKVEGERKVFELQMKDEKRQKIALYIGIGLTILFAVFMYRRFQVTRRQKQIIETQKQEVEKQKHLVEEKQKEILDSIRYAQKIQRALVTNERYIEKTLNRMQGPDEKPD